MLDGMLDSRGSAGRLCPIACILRHLIDFFYGHPSGRTRHPDDICASDFVEGWDPEPPDHQRAHIHLLDKHLAHLTLQRSEDRADGTIIEVGPIADVVLEVATDFAVQIAEWQIRPGAWTVCEHTCSDSHGL